MLLLKGLLIGLSIAATVGPMSMLCIQRTLERGRLVGMFSGLGIATADGLYALVAGLGLSAIMHLLISQQFWIRLVGGLFLFYLGLKTMLMRKVASASSVQARTKQLAVLTGFIGIYLSMLLLTLANPLTILSFVVIFAGGGYWWGACWFGKCLTARIGCLSRLRMLVVDPDQYCRLYTHQTKCASAALD